MLIRLNSDFTDSSSEQVTHKREPFSKHPPRVRRARLHHRAFLAWLDGNRFRLAHDIRIQTVSDESMDFTFSRIHHAVSGTLTGQGICIPVNYQGTQWDFLKDFDAYPQRVPRGYICAECLPEHKKIFPTLLDLWADHVFEPLLSWVNSTLTAANWLVLKMVSQEHSCACLDRDRPEMTSQGDAQDSTTIIIPLRQ